MKSTTPTQRTLVFTLLALFLCLAMTGCEYNVPATIEPTRGVDDRLLGDWIAMGGWMKVRRLDASGYVIFHDGELYRAWHSGVAGLPLVSVQDIDSDKRKFAYLGYALSDDGRRLTLRVVNDKLIPDDTKDSDRVKKLFEEHARDPALFGEGFVYVRQ
ncbi:MAG: hypothetical protein EXS37_11900 [Opitutus sp.]|nr:hypothetical protein [Opitutus sp.]